MNRPPAAELKQRRKVERLRLLERFMIASISLLGLVLFTFLFLPVFDDTRAAREKLDHLRNEKEKLERLHAKKQRELDLLKTNPEYLEIIARDKMDLMKPGEVIVRIH